MLAPAHDTKGSVPVYPATVYVVVVFGVTVMADVIAPVFQEKDVAALMALNVTGDPEQIVLELAAMLKDNCDPMVTVEVTAGHVPDVLE